LGQRNYSTVLIEGGGELAAAALRANAVDMVEFHIAPKILGGKTSIPVIGGFAPDAMADALELHHVTYTQYGNDLAVCGYLREW
jgi:diaminohydroxyphosphoribosylaminopyrimidine deaminase/5-amino-6-(5-phosphoribosylamino)uracil reductase